MFWCHEELNAPRRVGLAADQAISFERHDHLMDRGWADAEMALHIGLGRRASEHGLLPGVAQVIAVGPVRARVERQVGHGYIGRHGLIGW